jgi:hypothetical protein
MKDAPHLLPDRRPSCLGGCRGPSGARWRGGEQTSGVIRRSNAPTSETRHSGEVGWNLLLSTLTCQRLTDYRLRLVAEVLAEHP